MTHNASRSSNLVRNSVVSIITQIVILLVSFVTRTIFIRLLGMEYLGVDSLFGSILTVLSLAELGLGSAIIYNLYRPIAEGNHAKARQYLSFYSKAYNVIIVVVSAVGICLIPFLKFIVRADKLQVDINLYVVYLLFLANTVSSYFLAHRQAVLVVNQRQSTVSTVQMAVKIISLTAESLVLLCFKNYYFFLIIKVVSNYFQAIIISLLSKKRYPELCEKSSEKLSTNEINVVKKNVSALLIRRVGSIVLSTTDNLIINGFISTAMVGVYSNYVMIISSIQTITGQLFSAMTATIGNFVASKKKEEVESLFRIYTYAIYLVYGFCSVCLYCLTNNFISLLWGESYLLPRTALFIIVINFTFYGFQTAINVFRDTTGLFVQGKYRALFSAAVNVLLSLLLVKPMGISGVVLATVLSRVFVSAWFDPLILYKKYFESPVKAYFIRFCLYVITVILACLLTEWIISFIGKDILGFVLKSVVCVLCSSLLLLPFCRSKESKELFAVGKSIAKKVIAKFKS